MKPEASNDQNIHQVPLHARRITWLTWDSISQMTTVVAIVSLQLHNNSLLKSQWTAVIQIDNCPHNSVHQGHRWPFLAMEWYLGRKFN